MPAPIDYASLSVTHVKARGVGYYVLVGVNVIALLLTACLFLIEVSGSHAAVLGFIVGPPLAGAQLVLGVLPSWAYVAARGEEMSRDAKVTLIGVSTVPAVLGILGMVLSGVGG